MLNNLCTLYHVVWNPIKIWGLVSRFFLFKDSGAFFKIPGFGLILFLLKLIGALPLSLIRVELDQQLCILQF